MTKVGLFTGKGLYSNAYVLTDALLNGRSVVICGAPTLGSPGARTRRANVWGEIVLDVMPVSKLESGRARQLYSHRTLG